MQHSRRTLVTSSRGIALVIALLISMGALAQPSNAQYRNLLLFSQFGEFCTMCEAVLLCTANETMSAQEAVPEDGSFTLYHLKTRTFWSQIYTIWEWFIAPFQDTPISGHTRPGIRHDVIDGQWQNPKDIEVHVSLEPPVLTLGESTIDRRTSTWTDSATSGGCVRLPLWDALASIQRHKIMTR